MMGNNSLNFKTYFSEDGENWNEIKTTKPILATGGIITNKLATIGESVSNHLHQDIDFVIPLKDKYYKIYKRTKNRRIKKKNFRKSWLGKIKIAVSDEIKSKYKKRSCRYI